MQPSEPLLFALDADHDLGLSTARSLGCTLADHEERRFEDGEHKIRPLVEVAGRDVYILSSLHGDGDRSVNDKLVRLLHFLGALKDSFAGRVTALVPYMAYARKDRRTKPRDPVAMRYTAQLFEALGLDRIVVMDVHNIAAFENAFRCPKLHLEAASLFAARIGAQAGKGSVVVVSPDSGGAKRAERLRQILAAALGRDVAIGFLEKTRSGGIVGGDLVVGPVGDGVAVIVDDLISTGTTILRGARACREAGARMVLACATHGVFTTGAERLLDGPELDHLIVTNSVSPAGFPSALVTDRFEVVDVGPVVAQAVTRLCGAGTGHGLMKLDL